MRCTGLPFASLILAFALFCQPADLRADLPKLPGIDVADLDEDELGLLEAILKEQFDPCGKPRSFLESLTDPDTCKLAPRLGGFVVGQIQRGFPKQEIVQALRKELHRLTVRHAFDAAGRPQIGPEDAKVTLVEFYDYQCPFCRTAASKVPELLAKHEGVRFVAKQYPLDYHAGAKEAAIAVVAAHMQGKFEKVHAALFAAAPDLDEASISKILEKQGLDMKRFEADRKKATKMVEADMKEAEAAGVEGTPTFYVNGLLSDYDELGKRLEEALEAGSK